VTTGDVAAGLALVPGFGLALGLVSGLRQERAAPNEGIRRSVRHALRAGLVAGLISGSPVGILFALVRGTAAGSVAGVGFGLVFALVVGLLFGGAAVMQHYVMRAFLVRARVAPWRPGVTYGTFIYRSGCDHGDAVEGFALVNRCVR
jgi:hypothetical protein